MPEYVISLSDRSPSEPTPVLKVMDGPTLFFTRGKEESMTLELTPEQARSIYGFDVKETPKSKAKSKRAESKEAESKSNTPSPKSNKEGSDSTTPSTSKEE